MKLLGRELTFNNNEIWHKGNFDPASKVDKAEFDNLEIGGRNLALIQDYSHDNQYQTVTKTDETFNGQPVYRAIKKTTSTPPTSIGSIIIRKGETFTASIWIKHEQQPTLETAYLIFYKNTTLKSVTAKNNYGEWERLIVTYTNNTDADIENVYIYFYPARGVGDVTYFTCPQIERGNKATDWTPAPEDVQAEIDKKADISVVPTKTSQLTNDSGFITSSASITGNAATATKLQTARKITLSGDVSGSASFDGSSNISINATVVDDSHNHIISNVDGLQVALDGKSDIAHNHNLANLAERNYTSLVGRPADDDFHMLTELLDSANDDELVIYDVSDSSYKKITRENLLAGLLSSSQFVFIRKKEEFTATEGQTVFNLTQGSYEVGTGRVDVYIWGNKQPPSAYTETSSTSITLVNGVEAGTKVLIEYIQIANVMDYIHAQNHKIGGSDPITPADIGAISVNDVVTTATANKILKLDSNAKLPASITGDANTLDGKHASDFYQDMSVVMNTNPFGGKRLYINSINNAIFKADKRWNVTGTIYNSDDTVYQTISASSLSELFDGNYEGGLTIPMGKYAKINIDFSNSGTLYNGVGVFPGYPYGYIYLSHYYTGFSQSAKLRVYCNYDPHGIGWHEYSFSDFVRNGTTQLILVVRQPVYAISQMEFVIYAQNNIDAKITEVDFQLDRPGTNEMPILDKFRQNKLYSNLDMNSNKLLNVATPTLNSDGVNKQYVDDNIASHTHTKSNITDFAHTHNTSEINSFNEDVQDAIGAILTDTSTIDFTYDDVNNQIKADVKPNSSNQKVAVSKNNTTPTGTRKQINFKDGTNISVTVADNVTNDAVDVTITNTYTHPTGDGNLHVPATGTTNNNKVLKAGSTAGSLSWGNVDWSELTNKPSSSVSSIDNAVTNSHAHSNKALLDTYTQTEANLADAVSKKHSQNTDNTLTSSSSNTINTTGTGNIVNFKVNNTTKSSIDNKGNFTGKSASADKLATARTITLTGDVTGSASFDGSANISISATVADDSHNHVISNIDNLQTTLNSKAPLASPAFTGTPTAPTAPNGTNTDQIATTKFVQNALSAGGYGDMLRSQYDTDSDGIVDRAETADKLTTARTISLSGDVTGSVVFDGSSNVSITTAVADDSHNHTSIEYKDTRSTNHDGLDYQGVSMHLKYNTTDSLNDGGTYHGVLHLAQWKDISGGKSHQLGFTDNGNIWYRNWNGYAWSSWVKIAKMTDITIPVSTTAPSNPSVGSLWIDTNG